MQIPARLEAVLKKLKDGKPFEVTIDELRDVLPQIFASVPLQAYMREQYPMLSEAMSVQPMHDMEMIHLAFNGLQKADRGQLMRLLVWPGRYQAFVNVLNRKVDDAWMRAAA